MSPLTKTAFATLCLVLPAMSLLAAKPKEEPAAEEVKRELLSLHRTVATFVNVEDRVCLGATANCPDRCGSSGSFATFKILTYVEYKKLGQYGDKKAKEFVFQLADNHKNAKVSPEIAKFVADLKAGDQVRLDWNHEYVTTTTADFSSSSPERPIVKLEKITEEEAQKPTRKTKKEPAAEEVKRELLSLHRTVATFDNVADRVCLGLTEQCPDRCGSSGSFATFKILTYVEYKKLGQYGDKKAKEFVFQLADNHKNAKVSPEIAKFVADLKAGDQVRLDWNHEYVTTTTADFSSSSPERPIVKLEKITQEEAQKLSEPRKEDGKKPGKP